MNNSNKPSRFHFAIISLAVIASLAATLVLFWPNVMNWRWNTIDSLIEKAKSASSEKAKFALLKQAHSLDTTDPRATQAIAKFYQDRGDEKNMLLVYESSLREPNNIYLGELSLATLDYSRAKRHFTLAKEYNEPAATTGLSRVAFASNNIAEGCSLAQSAQRLNLNSTEGGELLQICQALGGTTDKETSTEPLVGLSLAYTMLRHKIYLPAEKLLVEANRKSALDYQWLAKIAAVKGETGRAEELLESASQLQPGNAALIESQQNLANFAHPNKETNLPLDQQKNLQNIIDNR